MPYNNALWGHKAHVAQGYSQLMERRKYLLSTLPLEVVHNIFVIGAMESQSCAFTLCLVSKSINRLLTPILYYAIELNVFYQNLPFFRTIMSNPEFSGYITNLYLSDGSAFIEPDVDQRILSLCSNLQRLVLDLPHCPEGIPMTSAKWPKPWEVVLISRTPRVLQNWLTHPVLRGVTHLFIGSTLSTLSSEIEIGMLENDFHLTHLGLFCPRAPLSPPRLGTTLVPHLVSLPSLRMLLLVSDGTRWEYGNQFLGPIWDCILDLEDKEQKVIGRPSIEVNEFMDFLRMGKTIWEDAKEHHTDWRERTAKAWPEWMLLPSGNNSFGELLY